LTKSARGCDSPRFLLIADEPDIDLGLFTCRTCTRIQLLRYLAHNIGMQTAITTPGIVIVIPRSLTERNLRSMEEFRLPHTYQTHD
jgi:hypothetical protein